VVIDPRTEAALTDPRIFWHPYYGDVLRAASRGGARAIGLDVVFSISVEPWKPDLDRQIAAAYSEVSATTPVVLAYDKGTPQTLALYMLASAMNGTGFSNLTLDEDGFVRRQELLSNDAENGESFAARLAEAATNSTWTRKPAADAASRLFLG